MTQATLQFGVDLDQLLDDAFRGKPRRLTWAENVVLFWLQKHRGITDPIPLRELAVHLPETSDREIKAIVRALVMEVGIPVGASRSEPTGYYLAQTAEERLAAARPYIREIRNLALRVRALVGKQQFVELLGQMRFEGAIRW